MVACADAGEEFYQGCGELQICVAEGTTHIEILGDILRGDVIAPYNDTETLMQALHTGKCNVVASEPVYLSYVTSLYQGADWALGTKIFSKEPLSLTTRQDDPEWSALVNLAIYAFISAETHGITKENAHDFTKLVPRGSASTDLASTIASLISKFGHHGDLYHYFIEWQIPRTGRTLTMTGISFRDCYIRFLWDK